MMSDSYGAPQADGLLPSVEPVPVSPLRAAIPSAAKWALFYDDYPDCERLSVEYDCNHTYFSDRACIIWNGNNDNTVYATPEEARWLSARLLEIASAIETRSAKTEGLGPQDESAAPQADAQPQEPTP